MTTTTDVYAGKELGALELTVTDEMIQHYIKGLDEPNPWYTTASPFGGPVAPVIVYQDVDTQFKGWYLDNLFGNLWRRQEWEIHAPTRVGQALRCSARVADRYRRRDRDVVAMELWVRDAAGALIARGVHHQSFMAEQNTGEVALRDPASKEGARAAAEATGEPLSLELRKTFTEAMCNEYFFRSRNYHNDKDASKALGFGDTVIGGRMTLSCVTELLTRHFGRGFYLGGRLDVKFTNVLWPNEPFTTRGIITGRRQEGGQTRADVTVYCEKADGTKIIVANASALEGLR
jgi:acyl dehydratase